MHAPLNWPAVQFWLNGYQPPLYAITLYGIVREQRPGTYLEIGSGNSTKWARKAIRDRYLETQIISIDPFPRADIDGLCHEVIGCGLEDIELSILDSLGTNDILFFDGSHYVLPNSDVVTFFLEVLPRLKPGVLVHLHDVPLPFDYPEEQIQRNCSEQYILDALFLLEGTRLKILQPNAFVSNVPVLSEMAPVVAAPRVRGQGDCGMLDLAANRRQDQRMSIGQISCPQLIGGVGIKWCNPGHYFCGDGRPFDLILFSDALVGRIRWAVARRHRRGRLHEGIDTL